EMQTDLVGDVITDTKRLLDPRFWEVRGHQIGADEVLPREVQGDHRDLAMALCGGDGTDDVLVAQLAQHRLAEPGCAAGARPPGGRGAGLVWVVQAKESDPGGRFVAQEPPDDLGAPGLPWESGHRLERGGHPGQALCLGRPRLRLYCVDEPEVVIQRLAV